MLAGDQVTKYFTTSNDGVAQFADSLPTVVILLNENPTTVPVTVVQTAVTGQYRYTFTAVGAWARGDEIHARINATIGGVNVSIVKDLGEVEVAPTITLSAAQIQQIADAILVRGAANVDGTAQVNSLYTLIQAAFNFTRPNTDGIYQIFQTDGTTVHTTKTVDTTATAEPVTGVS